jgi:pyruvate ferredoxin oxidoreductase beta subunit
MGRLTSLYLRHARQDGKAPSDSAIDIGKEVVDCGLWYLTGREDGEFVSNRNPKEFTLVQDFLFRQARFRHLKAEDVEQIIPERDMEWTMIRKS